MCSFSAIIFIVLAVYQILIYYRLIKSNNTEKKVEKKHWKKLFDKEIEKYSEEGLYLRGLRIREGYTQVQLGDMIGVTQKTWRIAT